MSTLCRQAYVDSSVYLCAGQDKSPNFGKPDPTSAARYCCTLITPPNTTLSEHTDTHTALTDCWLFTDFMHQKEHKLFQTHMRKCSFSRGVGGWGSSVHRSLLSIYQSISITEHFALPESSPVTLLGFNYFWPVNSRGGQSMTENKHMHLRRVLVLITACGSNQLELREICTVRYFVL